MSNWNLGWRKYRHHWDSKPDRLKPKSLNTTLPQQHADPAVLANYDIRSMGINPYRGNNLIRLIRLSRTGTLPKALMNTRVINSTLQYKTALLDGGYRFNDPRDPKWGAKYLLGCLLPILYNRIMSWDEIDYLGTLGNEELVILRDTLCENQPDIWWPFYMKGEVASDDRKPHSVLTLLENNRRGLSLKEICETLGPSAKHAVHYYSKQRRVKSEKGKWKLVDRETPTEETKPTVGAPCRFLSARL